MLILAADHGGFSLKEEVKRHLDARGVEYTDCGTHCEESVDYPVFAKKALDLMKDKEQDRVILICGTGLGMMLCANRVQGVRAVCVSDPFSAQHARSHNNANVLCFGGRVIDSARACQLVDLFLDTEFDGERHSRRLSQIDQLFSK